MKFKDLKLKTKQIIGFGLILAIMAAVNFYSVRKMEDLKEEIDEVSNNWLPRSLAIADIKLNTSYLRISQLQHAIAADSVLKGQQEKTMVPLIDKINENLDTYDALRKVAEQQSLYSEEERELFSGFNEQWEAYQDFSFTFFTLSRKNESQQAIQLLNSEALTAFTEFSSTLDKLVNINKQDAQEAASRAEKTFHSTRKINHTLLLATILLSVMIAGFLVRQITGPVQKLEKAAREVAGGNLDVQLEISGKDEIGNMSNSFNQMTISLREATEKMKLQAETLQKQAKALLTTNRELEEKSKTLTKQKSEIEQKNSDLEKQKSEIEEKNKVLEKQKIEIIQKNIDLQQTMEELNETQQQLLLKEKMAALGDLVAGIAHEINNPIGAVNASTDVLRRCAVKIETALQQGQSIEEIRKNPQLSRAMKALKENIGVTLTAGDRIATLVKSLKNFARLDQAEYQRADIHEGIESTLVLMGTEIQQRINIEREFGELPRIECYPGQLNQVFINVLKNAVQAIEGSGTINIKTFIDKNGGKDKPLIQVQISDTGKGIPAENLDKLFDLGFTSDGESRVKMRTGLVTVFNIIQKHNGNIRVDSQVGKGTTFSIILPIK